MAYDDNNIFAKIIRGDIPCDKVYEDDYSFAFHDINPKKPIHVLVLPKGKYVSFDDFSTHGSPEEVAGFMKAVAKVARDLGVADQGYRLIANKGANGGQEVDHFHVHILGGEHVGPMVIG